MALSTKAVKFLENSERDIISIDETAIRDIFAENKAPVFEPLIQFQLAYGGYTFYAGLAPIRFSLLHGLGGYPASNYTAFIDFEANDAGIPKYYFNCASTNYQMQFFLDERGQYYEDYEVKSCNFEKTIEHLALWAEMQRKDFELILHNRQLDVKHIEHALNLTLISEASDEYTQWYQNEFLYMEQWNGYTTIAASKHFAGKEKLADLI
ncbi:MAG: hypothetical protein EOP48_12035 [Sphingobacteriales bacterium]|nr:MAG: hypothetical protein EOP48_12035 [Sphingobacteriales bacterium]